MGSGWTAKIYEWGEGRVLKLFEIWVPKEWAEYEYKTTRFAKESGLPVPTVDGVIEVHERHGIVMKRVDGPNMLQCMLFCSSRKMKSYAYTLAELQSAINSKKAPEGFQPIHRALENRVNHENTIPPETKEVVLHILEKLPAGDALCHYDLHPNNIMMSPKGPVIIDWSAASRGDPMADVARTWFLCTLPPIPWPLGAIFYPRLRFFYKQYLEKYTILNDVNEKTLELWKIPVLAARISEERNKTRKKFLLGVLNNLIEKAG